MRQDEIVSISIALPFGLAHRLRVLAAQQNKSRSRLIREVMETAFPPLSQTNEDSTKADRRQEGNVCREGG